LDTFGQAKTVGFDANGAPIRHYPHLLSGTLEHIYRQEFLPSDEYAAHLALDPTKTIKLTLFKEHARCPCMVQPKFRFCADELQVSLLEIIRAIREYRRNPPPERRNVECLCPFCVDFKARKALDPSLLCPESNEHTFLQHIVVCQKIKFPGSEKYIYQQKCMFMKDNEPNVFECGDCDKFRRDELCFFNCPARFNGDVRYKYRRYAEVVLDTSKTKELETVRVNGTQLLAALLELLPKYLKHHWEYKWLHNCHMYDINACGEDTIVMQADYSAVVELTAQDKLNSAISGYAQMACFAVMHSPEMLQQHESQVQKKFLSCDHIRVITPGTKGAAKDGDWFCHAVMLSYLIYFYQRTLAKPIRRIILWTDGSPSQYKCRQNFGYVAVILRSLFPDIEVFCVFS